MARPEPWKKQPRGIPRWVKAIPQSTSHGSGHLQKRLWRLTSDYARIRDWYQFQGLCIATGVKIAHWTQGDAGHWKSYSVCNGMYKFALENIHLQCKSSNGWGGQEIGHAFGEELKRRYGPEILTQINDTNKNTSEKFSNQEIIERMREILVNMEYLPEQPSYYSWVVSLMGHETA